MHHRVYSTSAMLGHWDHMNNDECVVRQPMFMNNMIGNAAGRQCNNHLDGYGCPVEGYETSTSPEVTRA